MEHYSDKDLLDLFNKEDTRNYAFNLLVRKYQGKIYWTIRRLLVDHDDTNDVTQDVFIKIWKNLDSFKENAELFTWIYRIAVNESLTFLNKKSKRFFLPFHDVEKELSEKIEDDNFFKGDEIQKKLQKAILTLPPKQRLVFNMKYFDEMKYEDMSKILKTSVGALKASYHIAAKKIEEFLTND